MTYVIAGFGEVSPVGDLARAEDALAQKLTPFHPVINKLEAPNYLQGGGNAWKARFKIKPITALLELFQPLENMAKAVVKEANSISGKYTRRIGGIEVNMVLDQPQDNNLDLTAKTIARRMRTLTHYMTLIHQDPRTLAQAIAAVARKEGSTAVQNLVQGSKVIQEAINNLPKPSTPPPPPPAPSLPPNPFRMGGLGLVPVAAAGAGGGAAAGGTGGGATVTTLAIAAAPIIVPAVVTLILGLTKQASGDIKEQKTAVADKKSSQTAADSGSGSSMLLPGLAALAVVGYVAMRRGK